MQKGIVIHILIVIHCILMLTSCEYDYIKPIKPAPIQDTVSFTDDIIPIFENSCNAGCHETGGYSPDLSPDNAYSSIINGNLVDTLNPESSEIYIKLVGTGSHDGRSDINQRSLILGWIQQGAKNN